MSLVTVEFRHKSSELPSHPTLSNFLARAAQSGNLGQTNANRLLASGVERSIGSAALELVQSVADDKLPQKLDIVAPLLRVATDFESGEPVKFKGPGGGTVWQDEVIWRTERPNNDGSAPLTTDERGTIYLQPHSYVLMSISPAWPGLVPLDFFNLVAKPVPKLKKGEDISPHQEAEKHRFAGVARVFFALSFFQADEEIQTIYESANHGLRKIGAGVAAIC